MLESKYGVIYADPPWFYNKRSNKGTKFGLGHWGHYQPMKTDEICAMDIQAISQPDCALFLWATWPKLPEAMKVIEAWGFAYRTIGFIWVKTNKDGGLFFGPGYYTRSNTEPCLLAVKGQMPPEDYNISSVVVSERTRHSEKPPEVREKIERLYPNQKKIELFARHTCPGWDAWGNEVGKLDAESPKSD